MDETYIQAYEREQRPKSHLITIASDSDDSDLESDDNDEAFVSHYLNATDSEESDQEDVFAIHDIGWKAMVADRPEKKIAARQKMVMDGVYPPKLKDLVKGKENRPVDAETGRPIRPGKTKYPKQVIPRSQFRRRGKLQILFQQKFISQDMTQAKTHRYLKIHVRRRRMPINGPRTSYLKREELLTSAFRENPLFRNRSVSWEFLITC